MTPSGGVFRINGYNSVRRINSKKPDTGVDWWLAGGIAPANCIAAYQPIGAASYAASKVNLANPGTYDATEGTAPDWDAVNGWTGNGSNYYLKTGIVATAGEWSAIVRYSNIDVIGLRSLWGSYNQWFLVPRRTTSSQASIAINNTTTYFNYNNASYGVICISGLKAYVDGVFSTNLGGSAVSTNEIYLLASKFGSNPIYFLDGCIKAIAFYNDTLTPTQVSALTTAMNAL